MSVSVARVKEMLKKELRQMFRDPRMRPIVFGSPIIQVLVFGYAVNTDVRDVRTIVVDQDHTSDSRMVTTALTAGGYFDILRRESTPDAIERALERGEAVIGIQIPPGFSSDLRSGRPAPLQVLVDGTDSNTGTVVQNYVTRIVQDLNQAVAQNPTAPLDVSVIAWYNPSLESRVYNVPGVIGVLILIMTLLLTALAVVRERELGTLDQLVVTPLQPAELILGKTIPVALVGLVDLVLISSIAVLWFEIPLRGSPLVLLPAAMIYIVAGLSLGLTISSISKTQQEAFMTMFLFILPAIILSGFFFPISSMPSGFREITLLNPVRHFLEIVRGVFLKSTGYAELWTQVVVLALMAGGGLWFATNRFKRSIT